MQHVKAFTKNQIEQEIANNPVIGEDTISDHNKIETLLKTCYMLRILKLVVILLNMSYFVGMMFMIVADAFKAIAYELGDTD